MTASERLTRSLRTALIALAAVLVLAHCWRFRDFTVDDAAISYAYAQNFAHGHGLVGFAGGERVEGYSNFSWVVLVGVFTALFGHVLVVAKVLGAALAVVTVVSAAELLAAVRGRRSRLDAIAALLCAAMTPIPYWSMSGLENPLFLSLTALAAARLLRELDDATRRPWSALWFAGVALTRPDGLVIAVVGLAAQLLTRHQLRRAPLWLGLCAAPIALHLAWRYAYYAYPWPNTYYVKKAFPFDFHELIDAKSPGWKYLLSVYERYHLRPLVLLAPLALITRRLRAPLVVWALLAAVLFFPLYARGDWMSEGRFAVGALPLFFVLALYGLENVARLACRLPAVARLARRRPAGAHLEPALTLLGAAALAWLLVPTSLQLSAARAHHYPVPVEVVAERAREYQRLATALAVESPAVADGDAGGNLLYAGMPLVDIGWLTDGTLAHWGRNPGFVREYIFGERRPTFIRIRGYWRNIHLQDYPEFDEYLAAPEGHGDGLFIARAAFTSEGIDSRDAAPLSDDIALVGSDVSAGEVRAWLLARRDHARGTLSLHSSAGTQPVVPGERLYPPQAWRAGEVVNLRLPRPAPGPVDLCVDQHCVALPEGRHGHAPVAMPPPTSSLSGAALYARAKQEQAAGDTAAAFADYQAALRADASLAFARRRLEELRTAPRAGYHPWLAIRAAHAARAFALAPSADTMTTLAQLANAAHEPRRAVLAHLATGILPPSDGARRDLAACYARLGLPERAAAIAPSAPAPAATRAALATDFEQPGLAGWRADGMAFEDQPRTQQWNEQFGVQGNGYIATKLDAGGQLSSSELAPDVAEVCFFLAGGASNTVALAAGAVKSEVVRPTSGLASGRCLRRPPQPATGWRIELTAAADISRLIVDDFTCFTSDGRSTACAQ